MTDNTTDTCDEPITLTASPDCLLQFINQNCTINVHQHCGSCNETGNSDCTCQGGSSNGNHDGLDCNGNPCLDGGIDGNPDGNPDGTAPPAINYSGSGEAKQYTDVLEKQSGNILVIGKKDGNPMRSAVLLELDPSLNILQEKELLSTGPDVLNNAYHTFSIVENRSNNTVVAAMDRVISIIGDDLITQKSINFSGNYFHKDAAVSPSGDIYTATLDPDGDKRSHICVFDENLTFKKSFWIKPLDESLATRFYIDSITVNAEGHLFACVTHFKLETQSLEVYKIDLDNETVKGTAIDGVKPTGMDIDVNGELWVCGWSEQYDSRFQGSLFQFSSDLELISQNRIGSMVYNIPRDISINSDGNVYLAGDISSANPRVSDTYNLRLDNQLMLENETVLKSSEAKYSQALTSYNQDKAVIVGGTETSGLIWGVDTSTLISPADSLHDAKAELNNQLHIAASFYRQYEMPAEIHQTTLQVGVSAHQFVDVD